MITPKPYQSIPILESGEPLVSIPEQLARTSPHIYRALGAPYGDRSPFLLRAGVVTRLMQAQTQLQAVEPGWRIQIFDGYRPVPVQQFMVEYTFRQLLGERDPQTLSAAELEALYARVYQFWAPPSLDPPPPHSTGGAVDVMLVDAIGQEVPMGSPIDEVSERSFPDYFAQQDARFHHHRQQLFKSMTQAGFERHPNEWWHFCWGDQLWAWLGGHPHAHYGRVD
ncbi:M15 family metallopeptidase [Anthocerotibacter panamensis]|uniref:M15 family metallopeptidase n=1 Tax=Anthocerotibacter panamensis TaxID=2857077 RepID=UPI001C406D35|nr:M15 family metallopeptidase [Anthocerotibacter panamensis]